MKARIYRPAKIATQSGTRNTHSWVLEFEPEAAKKVDSLMGWTGTSDMRGQVKLKFDCMEDAKAYAERNGIPYDVQMPHVKKRRIQAYSDNFK
ncbi:NADH-ubiquinone oxidoreductase [Kordiimonas sediminis]|uniref:NADH-ubiquinone oxidoreductase n=1 Tax=Kordiimonas sediminis TaxID=1735581 RepID=A0A919AVE0_9PROT|nr:ETC complex I subunit [Kordiimonas sediminis]GHF25360.1 NADH-ubiquinone oxidoreductase [Kordiimonas sediminis]